MDLGIGKGFVLMLLIAILMAFLAIPTQNGTKTITYNVIEANTTKTVVCPIGYSYIDNYCISKVVPK